MQMILLLNIANITVVNELILVVKQPRPLPLTVIIHWVAHCKQTRQYCNV